MGKIPHRLVDHPEVIYRGEVVSLGLLLARLGFQLVAMGKVRNTYEHPDHPGILLIVATDRISIFDFVLNAEIDMKGEVLTALSHFWFNYLAEHVDGFEHHMLELDRFPELADVYTRDGSPLLNRCMVVERLTMLPFELIFRMHLGGSVWKAYEKTGVVAGMQLPAGLTKWQLIPGGTLFTPSTKAEEGHDENITQEAFYDATGEVGRKWVSVLGTALDVAYAYAREKGILILDTKIEVGQKVGDEFLTPDSSRYTTAEDLEAALREGRDPVFFDKQVVRDWGSAIETPFTKDGKSIVGIKGLDPENEDHLAFVRQLELPESIAEETTRRYDWICEQVTGHVNVAYHDDVRGIVQ